MVRAPCCEKMGLRKGLWSSQEDQILTSFILRHGHGNWRALPKQAGLLRCGKSCRLRWINYLRPDLKRGNFTTEEEEETIIKLHKALGNRWSVIAARFPGRTDNEIKNFWNTHLKKKLDQSSHDIVSQETTQKANDELDQVKLASLEKNDTVEEYRPVSPPQSSTFSDSSLPAYSNCHSNINNNTSNLISEIGDNFWSEAFSTETCDSYEVVDGFSSISDYSEIQFPLLENSYYDPNYDGMDFWSSNIFTV